MALVFKENSSFNNFKDILNYYNSLFTKVLNTSDVTDKENHGANPYLPDKWVVPTNNEDTTVQYIYNPGYNYLKSIINTVEATKNGIHKGLRTLFINYDEPEDYWQEDLNYNLINSYAEASKTFEFYNKKTQEFEERPEYFWTRGNYYDMLPMCTAGKYLLAYKTSVENACIIMEQYKKKFYEYSCNYNTITGETSGITMSYRMINSSYAISEGSEGVYWNSNYSSRISIYFYISFWNEYLSELKGKVLNTNGKSVGNMLKIGQETQYPEQNNDNNVIYTKKYYSTLWDDLSTGIEKTSQTVVNTKILSNSCGTYKSNIDVKTTGGN